MNYKYCNNNCRKVDIITHSYKNIIKKKKLIIVYMQSFCKKYFLTFESDNLS